MNICSKFCECHLPPGLQTIILQLFHNLPSLLFNEIGDYVNSKEYREPEWIQKMKEIQERLDSKWHILYWPWLLKWSNFCFPSIPEQTCSAKFTQEIKDCRILEGQKAKFEGVYTGNPPPEVTWEFNGVLIENDKDIQIKVKDHRTSLTILEGKTSHNGHYTCRVKNELGSDRTRALLTVKGKKLLWLF